MPIKLDQRPKVSVGSTEVVAVDFSEQLDSTEVLTGTPTVAEVTTSDLTITNKTVSTEAITILDRDVSVGKAVQFRVSGFKANTQYQIRITVTTTSSPARILVFDAVFDSI